MTIVVQMPGDHLHETRMPAAAARPGSASAREFDCFRELIEQREWVKGAVNYDEDLHFSSYYLRESCAHQTGKLYPGYTTLIAFYEGFNEHYYLLSQECIETARTIVEKALRRPKWLPKVVREIGRLSDRLTRVFSPRTSPARLARLSDLELLLLYQRHDARQRSLYRFARLPEALDRGVSYFSNYLLDQLRQSGQSQAEADETFSVLSQPIVPSVLAQEILEFEELVATTRAAHERLGPAAHASARTRMFLDPEIIQRLRAHQAKWRFLPYHGYGRRELATLGQYIERLAERLNQPIAACDVHGERSYAEAARARRERLRKLDLDPGHRALFEIYPEIGAAKLHRRYAQLRNFYYLDMLLAEIARRFGVSEWTVRCMLPDEVVAALKFRQPLDSRIADRAESCLFAILGTDEHIVTGSQVGELRHLLQAKLHRSATDGVLQGHVACRGKVVGRCRVVIRADDLRTDIEPGAIVVSESTDPDLIGVLKKAGGVLTEQGGVTSHAAIICREIGIPTIIGVEGLLDHLHDGDLVEVDAERGLITLLSRPANLPNAWFSCRATHTRPRRSGTRPTTSGGFARSVLPCPIL